MAKIEKYIIDRILERAKIEEVVGDFVELKKKGVRYLGLCPFHDDHTPTNFSVYPRKNCYTCFACGAKGGVVDFLMNYPGTRFSYPDAIRYLGKKYNIETDMTDFNYTPPPPRPAPPPLPMLELPMSMVKRTEEVRDMNRLVVWLSSIRWNSVQRSRLLDYLKDYHIGHSKQGMTIFWQIDEHQRVRTGKMMLYKADGHRDRDSRYNFDFIHSALFRDQRLEQYSDEKQEAKQCLFGLHLLNAYKRKDVNQEVRIVESEKSALICATAYGNHAKQVWMACGGLENLNPTRLAPIIAEHRRIVLYPDRDAIQKWEQKAAQLHYDRVVVDATPVTTWWKPCDGEKADIADVVVRMINESTPIRTINEVKDAMPKVAPLIDKLNLEIENDDRRDGEEA